MAATPMIGILPLALALLLGGGSFPPLSLPPLPPDAKLAAVAPEGCLLYVNLAGTAEPDPGSANRTERLLAEPQIRSLVAAIEKEITLAIRKETRRNPRSAAIGENVPFLVRTLLTRPAALYISQFQMGQQGPQVQAGLVVNVGDQKDKVLSALRSVQAAMMPNAPANAAEIQGAQVHSLPLPPMIPPVSWGVADSYVFVAVGTGCAENIIGRLKDPQAAPPAWLKSLRERLPVKRPAMTTYVSVPDILETTLPLLGVQGSAVVSALGLNRIHSLESVSGLDEEGFVSASLVRTLGPKEGLLSIMQGQPLKADRLAHVPADSTLAIAFTLEPEAAWRQILSSVEKINPGLRGELAGAVQEMEAELGFRLLEDVLAHAGPTWTLHNSPGEGGLVVTGLTATVEVKNREALERTLNTVMDIVRRELNEPHGRRYVGLRETTYRGHRLWFLNPVGEEMPVAPAWALTEKTLVAAPFPQMVKAHLDRIRDPKPDQSILARPELSRLFENGVGPSKIGFVDTEALVRLAYPALHPLATLACAALQREGLAFDVSMLPSASALLPHLKPSWGFVSSSEDGILMEQHSVLPMGGLVNPSVAGVAPFFLSSRVRKARASARRAHTMNNLKQLAMGAMMYSNDHDEKLPEKIEDLKDYLGDSDAVRRDAWGQPILYLGKGKKLNQIESPSETPLFVSTSLWRGQRVAAYVDGHVQTIPEMMFKRQCEKADIEYPGPGREVQRGRTQLHLRASEGATKAARPPTARPAPDPVPAPTVAPAPQP